MSGCFSLNILLNYVTEKMARKDDLMLFTFFEVVWTCSA